MIVRHTVRSRTVLVACAGIGLTLNACSAAPRAHATTSPSEGHAVAALAYAIDPPQAFAAAVQRGTRSPDGRPGPRYWQNFANYRIDARVDAVKRRLEGSARIEYRNNSPDALELLHLDLPQNLHAPAAIRFEEAEPTGGVTITKLSADGRVLTSEGEGARYGVFGTRLIIMPPQPLEPGRTMQLRIDYAFALPQSGAGGRMGYSDDDLLYLAYWYPQMAVYDDIVGWHPDPFVGTTEFYADFGNYEYAIDAPAGWIVLGTGTLENAEQVLTASGHGRLQRATSSDSTIRVLAPDDFPALATAKPRNGRLVWRMRADSVRDVAFAVARNVHWDARRTTVGDRNGDGVADFTRIDALYRPQARRWRDAAGYAAHAITFLSGFTGIPYPWPHMSAVEGGGIVGGGMEYPMMTLIGDYNDASDEDLYNVVAHELAHMWVPMLVSSDERRYSWLDEGTTTFNETQSRADFLPGRKHWLGEHEQYLAVARAGEEGEMMRRSAFHYSPEAFGVASYSKPASALIALRAVLGDDIFMNGYRTFLQQWKYRHPYPWDFFNTFEAASGRDLDWFWRSWYYETWVLDQAVGGTRTEGNSTRIFVENRGRMPLPTLLQITLGNGETRTAAIPVEHWLAGNRQGDVTLTTQSPVVRVEIDPEQLFPDIDRENNVWPR